MNPFERQKSLIVSSPPHLKTERTTPYIMMQVILALVPATVAAVVFFKSRALLIIVNCIIAAVVTEAAVLKIRRQPLSSLRDGSTVVTGLLLALVLPPATKWYAATVGSVFSILVVKHLFGGLGANIFNPALMGRAFLMAAYPKMLTSFIAPQFLKKGFFSAFPFDAVSNATPLLMRKSEGVITSVKELFMGNVAGSLGETSAFCLLLGGGYLLIRRIADWRIPCSLLATVSILSFFFQLQNPAYGPVLFHLLSGGLLLGALFMATDPVTTPVTKGGRYVFGIGCGVVIMIIRLFGGYPEGVMYAILFMNALTPLLNRYLRPKRFGS